MVIGGQLLPVSFPVTRARNGQTGTGGAEKEEEEEEEDELLHRPESNLELRGWGTHSTVERRSSRGGRGKLGEEGRWRKRRRRRVGPARREVKRRFKTLRI